MWSGELETRVFVFGYFPSIMNRKLAYLAALLVETLKERGWTADDIHFLGVEIINESGIL